MANKATQAAQALQARGAGAATTGTAGAKAGGDVQKVAKDFESVLLDQVLQQMKATIPDGGLFEDSSNQQIQGMFYSFLAQDVSQKGGMGLWKQLSRQLESAKQTLVPAGTKGPASATPSPAIGSM
jgi:Rod binding domain-containing protein